MILDRTWNKKEQKLTISYIDKLGARQFYSKYLHHIKGYEYDDNGEFETWNGKRCNKVFKDTRDYTPNEFELLEYMYEMPKELVEVMHAQNFPKVYFFDIETEEDGTFPNPEEARQKVTAISLVGPDLSCIVYGLHKLTDEQINLFRQRYLDWIENNEFAKQIKGDRQIKVLYQYFDSEEKMLEHFFTVIIAKVPILAGWNSYAFDMMYLTRRLERLFGRNTALNMIRKASPTGEIKAYSWKDMAQKKHSFMGPCHSVIIDYMEIVKQYDYILRPYESYSLDWVGTAAVKAHKIKYQGTLQQLYERDPEWYYFYNAIDSCIGELIHYKLKSLESPCAVSSVTFVPLQAAFGQVALGTANVFDEFYRNNKKIVWDYDSIERHKVAYEGAFCACVPGRYEFCVCDDFASLYPSQVRTCNFSFENIVENRVGPDSFGRYTTVKWTEQELNEFRKDPNYFVSIMGTVYKNDQDYAFRRVQKHLKQLRDKYKYTGQRIDSEVLVYIDNIINNKSNNIKFDNDVIELLKEKFNYLGNDPQSYILKMSIQEIKSLRTDIVDLRHEYSLLELAHKVLGNGLYGACANSFFYFFNPNLAADITGECRNLTKTMWHNLEEFFHETIWERKDLWQQFDFELDESMHDWYRNQPVSVYSDTDSIAKKSLLLIKDNKNIESKITIESLFNKSYDKFGLKDITKNNQEIVKTNYKVLNWTKENGLQYVPIKYIMRHKVSKEQFKIKTKSCKEIIVTGDHSCIVFRNGKQLSIKARDINKDIDKILSIYDNMKYQIEEIESVEQLENFNEEYVYDIEVDDNSHTFIANDILVHNSVYTTYGNIFRCFTKEYKEKYKTDRSKLDWILKFNKEFLDKQNNRWCEEIYNPRYGQNVHEFELETIVRTQINLKKKKYLKGYSFVKGKFYDIPKVSGTGIEIIKSTTPKLCREILTDLMNSLLFEYNEEHKKEYILEFICKLEEYRKKFYAAPIEDISQSVGIGDYNKYVIDDKNSLILGKQCPVSVQAIARYNYMAHKMNQDSLVQYAGKIKYYNVKIGKTDGYFGYPAGELPEWAPPVNMQLQWKKTVIEPINRFLEVMKIPLVNSADAQQLTFFD